MSTAIDGFELLQSIEKNSNAFSTKVFQTLKNDVQKAVETLIKKQLKEKTLKLDGFRAVRVAIAPNNLALMLEKLTDSELKTLAKKLDPHWPDLATANARELRLHIKALGAAEVEPMPKPQKKIPARAKSTASKAKTKVVQPKDAPLQPESMFVRSKRRSK